MWDRYLPPGRPSDAHLAVFRSMLRRRRRHTNMACVLGSTPELCDLALEEGLDLVLIDRSEIFHSATLPLRVYPGRGRVEIGDWLEVLQRYAGHFDAILSDLTSGNVPYRARPVFYRRVSDALAPGGAFVDKILTGEGGFMSQQDHRRGEAQPVLQPEHSGESAAADRWRSRRARRPSPALGRTENAAKGRGAERSAPFSLRPASSSRCTRRGSARGRRRL